MYKQKIRSFYLIFSLSVYIIACTKSAPAPSGLNNSNGNGRSSGNTTSTLTYINDTYTRIIVIFNNQIQTIQVGSNIVFSGTPGSKLSGTASTSGQTSTGTQVGLQLAWNINNTFPASGNASTDLDATSDFFFLNIINKSSIEWTKLYVNYGLQAQTLDNVSIPNDGKTYNIGYYKAYSNSNVRTENGNNFWYWSTLNLTGTINQSITITGN
jgi:hypothetical protein